MPDKGERARARLLAEASRLFAEKGYAKAATREICEAAGANVAAIHYHFGGKEGLYREVLLGPIQGLAAQFAGFDDPALPLRDALGRLLAAFVGSDAAAAAPGADIGMRLFLREMIEPTPVFAATVAHWIGPHHEAMARLFARHIGLPADAAPDEDVHRLVFGVIAMAHDYCMSREFMAIVAPRLLAGADPLQRARERLIDWALALVAHEAARRGLPPPTTT
jgi:TetR/AcrR family transcriptional regulator, regulator of cefoperazone and chloramphenicol sensitivity